MDRTLLEALEGGLVGAYEPCPAFSAVAPDEPICAGCGWLDREHELEADGRLAEVKTLRTRPAAPRRRRLAS